MAYVCGLSAELQAKAKEELKEKPEWRARDIDTLRQMILSNKGVKCRTDDHFLLRFLRARKFDYDQAYNLLINYLTIRPKTPEVFNDYNIPSVESIFKTNLTMYLPLRDSEGRRILYIKIGQWDPEQFSIYKLIKAGNMGLERVVQEEETQINGIILVADCAGMNLKHVTHMDRKCAKAFTSIMQECVPIRVKAMHFVHAPTFLSVIHNVFKPLLKEKMDKRISFHGMDHSSLYKHISPDVLPEELGGKLGPADNIAQSWYEELRTTWSKNEWMSDLHIELQNRINKKEGNVNAETVTGTFRKLNVD